MNIGQLAGWVLADEARIADAIAVGAGWEVWMQVELALILHSQRVQAAREVPYDPPSIPARYLDAIASDSAGRYAIELKVESASEGGPAVRDGVIADRAKLGAYTPTVSRWALGIAYTATGKRVCNDYAGVAANRASYYAGTTIGVLGCPV